MQPLFFMAILLILAAAASADRLHFTHGDYVDVDAWQEEGGLIIYQRFGGEISVPKEDVARIERLNTDPTKFQAPGSRSNPSQPSSVTAPPSPATTGSSTPASAVPSPETWTPEPMPSVPPPPKPDVGKVILADYWERQKGFALERMDYHASRKQTCSARYRTPSIIAACQNGAEDARRFWNERYIVATREYEKYR